MTYYDGWNMFLTAWNNLLSMWSTYIGVWTNAFINSIPYVYGQGTWTYIDGRSQIKKSGPEI